MDKEQLKKHAEMSQACHRTVRIITSQLFGIPLDSVNNGPIIFTNGGDYSVLAPVYDMVTDGKAHQSTINKEFIPTYVMNAAFSLEIYLKLIIFMETGQGAKRKGGGHNLLELYSQVSQEMRLIIDDTFIKMTKTKHHEMFQHFMINEGKIRDFDFKLDYILEKSGEAFIQWRYNFEPRHDDLSWFFGYQELGKGLRMVIMKLFHKRGYPELCDYVN